MHTLAFALAITVELAAQAAPQSHVPTSVMLEVRALDRAFDAALSADCAPERCIAKGCSYVDHIAVDRPRTGSLPGLGEAAGPGSTDAQEYLTEATCQLAYEKPVVEADMRALKRRLEQRLSKAWLKVTVLTEALPPAPSSLKDGPPLPDAGPEEDAAAAPLAPVEVVPEAPSRLAELWSTLLPHAPWMVALALITLATLVFIWAGRRLGKESIEDRMLAAQLAAGGPAASTGEQDVDVDVDADKAVAAADAARDEAFVKEQERMWTERIASKTDGAVLPLFREWLRAGEYDLLAKAVFVFGERVSEAISADADLAMKKMEFADHLRNVDESELPPPSEFFRRLNHHAVSSLLLSQDDVQLYRSLVEEFGSHGILRLVDGLGPRQGALLFALVPAHAQRDVGLIMTPELRVAVASRLLESTRISREEMTYLFDVLRAARRGDELPKPPAPAKVVDRGRELDAAGALSVLLPLIEHKQRAALFAQAQQRFGGVLPQWYDNILFGDMLLRLPEELRKDVLLEVDIRALAGWLSQQEPGWRERFVQALPPTIRAAVDGNMVFNSAREQQLAARRGHVELGAALRKQTSRGRAAFVDLVA